MIILATIVVLSLTSLVSGPRGGVVRDALRSCVAVGSYPFRKVLKAVEDGMDFVFSPFISQSASREELKELRRQYGSLSEKIATRSEVQSENKRLRKMLDFERSMPRLSLEPAEVIGRFEGRRTLIIDRGLIHGIREGMPVITEHGVAGIITQVDLSSSNVITLHNALCHVGAMVQRNRVRCQIQGAGSDLSKICTVQYIDLKDDVREGDIIVTSPESLFPSGLQIGKVTAVHEDSGSLYRTAELFPVVDPYGLDEVFIVRHSEPALEELRGDQESKTRTNVFEREAESELERVLTIQERFAP